MPVGPLVSTAACIAAVNVLLAQLLAQAVSPGAALRLGTGLTVALVVVVVASALLAVVGWRSYLRRRQGA